jgi:hypothetical protein
MFKKLQVAAVLLCMLSYAAAGTVSIGTASARGIMRVDSYLVKSNATLFDGSVVETGQSTANLRMNKGAEITMSSSSRGTLYRDHLVLQQGSSELAASNTFQLHANGVRVTANEPNARGVVSLGTGNTVVVASLNGSFGVTSDHGVLLANVRPGRSVSFAMQEGANPQEFYGVGLVTVENGVYYLTTDENVKHVLTCKDAHGYVGDKVVVSGTVQAGSGQPGSTQMLCVKSIDINGGNGPMSKRTKLLIAGFIIAGAIAAAIALSGGGGGSTTPPVTPQ